MSFDQEQTTARELSQEILTTELELSSLESLSQSEITRGTLSISSEEDDTEYLKKRIYEPTETLVLANLCINTIRFLCIDAINNANSGHPGICMGMAATAFVLFDNHLRFNPSNPNWINRDRFVLSAGHGSMLLYSLLHLYGYDSVSMKDIKQFRKLDSRTPGHPENVETPGVEVSTGPLGQGICNAVGLAIAEAHVASTYNRPQFPLVDNYTYCIAGDGCMMEGLSGEACSLAGHLKLGKLIVFYDDNHISIDGSTDLAFTEDVSKRFESYGWQVLHVPNGNTDLNAINQAIYDAKRCMDKPSLIKITTTIGYGAPNKQNSAGAHGSALGNDETAAARMNLKYEYKPFEIPAPALEHFRRKINTGNELEECWREDLVEYGETHPKLRAEFENNVIAGKISSEIDIQLLNVAEETRSKPMATRKHSKTMLNTIAPLVTNLIGGAADTSPSTLTTMECSKDLTSQNYTGRNIHFGVREHAMAAICNGMGLAGYNLIPYCSTFLVFSDYMRSAMRMASLSKVGTLFVLTHDSIALGEDGPSHQPIEHLASLRAMPNHAVWRPADSIETGGAYSKALESRSCPSTIALSRQSTTALNQTSYEGTKRGGYVVHATQSEADGTIIATGSELGLAVEAANILVEQHNIQARVVSMPCWYEFESQPRSYKRDVLCSPRERTIAVEAASSFGWSRYADYFVCVDEFGKSGAGKEVLSAFGITKERIVDTFLSMISIESD